MPVLVVVAAAVLITPRSDWKRRPKRRMGAAGWTALAVASAALILTLLIPDGLLRWIVIAAIVSGYVVSWRLFDRASTRSGSHRAG
jgi:amino acid transporter